MDTSWTDPRAALVAAILVAALAAPRAAPAEEAGAAASAAALHERGLALYRAADYAGAARAFEDAQALAPAPANLFNLSRCYERLGDLPRAVSTLEQYVALAGLPADRLERGRAELDRLRAALPAPPAAGPAPPAATAPGAVVTDPPGAAIFVDGRPHDGVSTPATIDLAPGDHVVEVRLAGRDPARRDVAVEAGRPQVVQIAFAPPSAEQRPPAPRVAWTGSVQVNAGAAFALTGDEIGSTALLGLDLSAGLRLGRDHGVGGRPWRLVRLELVVGFAAEVGAASPLLEVHGGGRLSVALGALPVRVEGELALALTIVAGDESRLGLGLVPAFAVVYRALPWLEIALRPARVEFLGLAGDFPGGFAVRWGLDAQVRFRI